MLWHVQSGFTNDKWVLGYSKVQVLQKLTTISTTQQAARNTNTETKEAFFFFFFDKFFLSWYRVLICGFTNTCIWDVTASLVVTIYRSLWHLLPHPPVFVLSVSLIYRPTVRASWTQATNFWCVEGSGDYFIKVFHESVNQSHVWLPARAHVNTTQTNTSQRRTHTILRVTGVTEPGKLTGLLTQVGRRHSYHRREVVGRQKQDDGMQEQDGREVRACTYVFATWDAREHMIHTILYTSDKVLIFVFDIEYWYFCGSSSEDSMIDWYIKGCEVSEWDCGHWCDLSHLFSVPVTFYVSIYHSDTHTCTPTQTQTRKSIYSSTFKFFSSISQYLVCLPPLGAISSLLGVSVHLCVDAKCPCQ